MRIGTIILLAFAVGVAAGVVVERRHSRSLQTAAQASGNAEQAREAPLPPRAERASPTGDLPETGAAPAGKPAATASLAELEARIAPLLEAEDGPALLELMAALARLGEPGYPAALRIAMELSPAGADYIPGSGVGTYRFQRALEASMIPALLWALQNQEYDEDTREFAVKQLRPLQAVDLAAIARKLVPGEPDWSIAREMIEAWQDAPGSAQPTDRELASIIRSQLAGLTGDDPTPASARDLVSWLAERSNDDPDAIELLTALAADRDGDFAETARTGLLRRNPPTAGRLVTYDVKEEETEYLKVCDIVVTANGTPAEMVDFREIEKIAEGKPTITFGVYREGSMITVEIPVKDAGSLNYRSERVEPRR